MTTDIRNQAEDGFHEIHLSGKQLVFLFMATTIVSIVIFLCGVLVGRGVRSDVGGSVSAASAPASGVEASAGEPLDQAAATTLGETKVDARDLSYPDRLGAAPPDENVKSATEVPDTPAPRPSAPVPAPAAEPKPPATAKAAPPVASKAEPRAAKRDVPEAVGTAGTTKRAPPASAAPPPAAPARGGYTVQVAAVKQRSEAEAIVRRLVSRGYEAYVADPGGSGTKMYRVRVGNYPDRRDAEKVMQRLTQEERFKPWITR